MTFAVIRLSFLAAKGSFPKSRYTALIKDLIADKPAELLRDLSVCKIIMIIKDDIDSER